MKAVLGSLAVIGLGLSLRTAVISGMALAQIGEFSFVLAKSGFDIGLGTHYLYQLFLGVSLITMALTPLLISCSESVANYLLTWPLPLFIKTGFRPEPTTPLSQLKNHVIIIGFGITGRNLARVLKETSIPYVILEMNSETVKEEKLRGEPIHFGDATHESVLNHMRVSEARALSVVINDPVAALRIVEIARKFNPSLYIIARTRRMQEVALMARRGASDVIPDEFGTSVEIFNRVLRLYQVPGELIEKFTGAFRIEGYEALKDYVKQPGSIYNFAGMLEAVKMETFVIEPDSPFANKSLGESDIRKKTGLTVMMIRRQERVFADMVPAFILHPDDKVTVCGTKEKIAEAKGYFKNEKSPSFST